MFDFSQDDSNRKIDSTYQDDRNEHVRSAHTNDIYRNDQDNDVLVDAQQAVTGNEDFLVVLIMSKKVT